MVNFKNSYQVCDSIYEKFGESAHRYLFNAMPVPRNNGEGGENDPEVSGLGNSYTTEFRQYDPRLGRWKSLDPFMMKFPDQSPYNGFGNNPIFFVDPYGLEPSSGGEGGGDEGGKSGSSNSSNMSRAAKSRGSQNGDGSADNSENNQMPEIHLKPVEISGVDESTPVSGNEAKADNTSVDKSQFLRGVGGNGKSWSMFEAFGFRGIKIYGDASSSEESVAVEGDYFTSIELSDITDFFDVFGKSRKKNKYNPYNGDPSDAFTMDHAGRVIGELFKNIYGIDVKAQLVVENEGEVEEKVIVHIYRRTDIDKKLGIVEVNGKVFMVGDTTVLEMHKDHGRHPDAVILDTLTSDGKLGLQYTGTYSPSHGHGRDVVRNSEIGFIK